MKRVRDVLNNFHGWWWKIGFSVMYRHYGVALGVPGIFDSKPGYPLWWTPVTFFKHAPGITRRDAYSDSPGMRG